MFKRPLEGRPGGIYWYILQTHSAAEVAFNRYVKLFPHSAQRFLWTKRPHESDRTVFLTGGREVHFKSGEKFDNLRVETLDGVIIDECREQDKRLWHQVVRPMLARRKGWAEFYSTPNGFDWFYDLAEDAKKKPAWEIFKAPSTQAWWWSPEEIELTKGDMSLAEFEQEILAEFRDLTSGRAYLFSDANKADSCPWLQNGKQWNPHLPVIAGLDFNLSPMSWTLGQESAQRFWWFDEIHLLHSHTLEAAQVLVEKINLMKLHGFRAEPNLVIIGDATGKATQRTSNQSDYDIVKEVLKLAGITFRDDTPEANPAIKARVNAVNGRCKNAKGEVNLWVSPTGCPKLVYDLERVTWKAGGDYVLNPGSDKMLTHNSDSIGYPIIKLAPVRGVREIGQVKVIHRTL